MRKSYLKFFFVLLCLGLLFGVGVVGYVFYKPKRNVAHAKAEFVLTSSQLLADFAKDEQAANQKYLSSAHGKVIRVTGIVAETTLAGDSVVTVLLQDPTVVEGGVYCSMEKSELEKVKSLRVGSTVSIKGECTGYLDITQEVQMVKCVFEKE
jgi:hypothetical protein